ncbi:MAG: 30S ribosomal protein S3 [archaeon]
MIEREFIKEKVKYLKAKEYIQKLIPKSAGIGRITIEKTPMGEKVTIDTVKPGLIIGRGGKTIAELTTTLKVKFGMENPQIEVREITNSNLSASVVASRIAGDLERFGPSRFKAIGYRAVTDIMNAGALGTEIKIAGRGVPGSRAQSWRFPAGYMKKCGKVAMEDVDIAQVPANLRSGTVGVQVMIMPPTTLLPDRIKFKEVVEEKKTEKVEEKKPEEIAKTEEKEAQKKRRKSKSEAKPEETQAEQSSADAEEKKDANTTG